MKKAQILSAIALAFALGVVAPVASASAFTLEDPKTAAKEGAASEAEVKAAIAAVSANYPIYDNMVTLNGLLSDTKITGADLTLGDNGFPVVYNNIVLALNALSAADLNDNADLTTKINEINADTNASFVKQINQVSALTSEIKHYDAIAAVVNALADKDDAALRTAIEGVNKSYALSRENQIRYDNDVTVANYNTTVKTALEAVVTNYSSVANVVSAVNSASKASTAYTTAVTKLGDAYKANGVMTTDGLNKLAAILNAKNPVITTADDKGLADLVDVAGTMNNYAAWVTNANSVKAAVENATKSVVNYAGNWNYELVLSIAGALKVAVPTPDKTAEQIATILVDYKAPAIINPGDGENKPGDNQGDDQNKGDDVNVSDSGVIAAADGTASSTVAIVAGIATALTAAGAGVVAYRNARRASKEA